MNMPNSENEKRVYKHLKEMGIEFEVIKHPPLFTIEDTKKIAFCGLQPKNLFLKDKKNNVFYLVTLMGNKRLDMKRFQEVTGASRQLTFAGDEELYDNLGVTRGACSPFNLINDKESKTVFVIMDDLFEADASEKMNFHPNINTKTIIITAADFRRYVKGLNNKVIRFKES